MVANETLAVEQALKELIEDRSKFIQSLFLVGDKNRRIRDFIFNPIQQKLYQAVSPPSARVVSLKPSQVGASTLIIALFLAETITIPGTTSVIVAHEEFITQRLLQKAQFFYDHLPAEFKPPMSHRSAHEKFFPDINSVMYIGSARAYVFGRGEVIHNFLADEYAFWADPDRIMVPALQRVPPSGRVIINSTPNGEQNAFYEVYQNATSGQGNWKAVFFPWYSHPEYRLSATSPLCLPADRGPLENFESDEIALIARGLDPDQIRWRRWKNAEMRSLRLSGSSQMLFKQEFPEDDRSCFLSAGNMVYDEETLLRHRIQCFDAPERKLLQHSTHPTLVWEPPQEGMRYVVAVDPGEGKTTRSGITVWRYEPDEDSCTAIHCATHASWDLTIPTARNAVEIATWYNMALLTCEDNAHGVAVINEYHNNLRYPNIYRREDILSERVGQEIGWRTTPRTKPYMIKEGQKMLQTMQCYDAQIVGEFANVRWVSGRLVEVGLDDLHMSSLINFCCRDQGSFGVGFVGTGGWSPSWGQ